MTLGRGLIVAAPTSGSGKTTVTLGLLRALSRRDLRSGKVRGAKSGPDYIDPRFHEAACAAPCFNLDAWAMSAERIRSLAAGDGLLIVEGAMGLFDGAPPDGKGATADLARILGLPVVLVIDASSMSQSVAPLAAGFAGHDPAVRIAAIILNRVGSPRHLEMLKAALRPLGIPVLGALMRDDTLHLPSRHLGLVQAEEHGALDAFIDRAADLVESGLDLDALLNLTGGLETAKPSKTPFDDRMGHKRLAVARDRAFAFAYAHLLLAWTQAGAEITFFSPLADDPVPDADLIYLPGGYPELHADRLAECQTFLKSIRKAAEHTDIYGECGGYMVLGETLTDADGIAHEMAGLLALQTSFAKRKMHLGYRSLSADAGPFQGVYKGHEFHYATTLKADGPPLFEATDAEGKTLPPMGLRSGRVCGSFAHVIASA
jgi:cobyrinic acid a,c-diamide synthase